MRDTTLQFSLPPFRGAVRYLILLTIGVWIAILLLYVLDRHNADQLIKYGELVPAGVLHGFVWQLLTYTFIHVSPMHVIFTLIAVYFIGSAVQERIGSRGFAQLYILSALLAAVIGVLLALTQKVGGGSAMGAGAAVNAVLMVFFLLHRGVSILLIPFPFRIPVEWVVVAVGGIETAYFVLTGFSLFYLVELLGLGTGYLWYRFMWRRATVSGVVSDRIGGIRNSYYRWKRERAKKKFQVYMRKHQQDPKQYFDEYGNFRPPDEQEKEKKDRGSSGGWVN